MADQQVIETPKTETTGAPETPAVDYQKQYGELEAKYKALESKYGEEVETAKNMDAYFTQDEVAKKRAELWVQAQREQKDFKELLKTLDTQAPPKEEKKQAAFDERSLDSMLEQKLQRYLDPVMTKNAELDLERSKTELFKSEPWLTEEKYKEFETRYGKKIDELATADFQRMGPFVTQQERQSASKKAYDNAQMRFAHLSEQELLRLFMADERDKFIAEGRRPAPKLPNGMVDTLPTGKAPELMKQLKQKYGAVEGNHEEVARLCVEFAPQLNMSPEEVHKLLG